MQYHRIPHSSLEVSVLGLGTMTFGEQNSEADAHAQLDYALAAGVNLIDTAELYPVPPRPETRGLTESYIGSWLKARGNREKSSRQQSLGPGARHRQQHPPAAGARSQNIRAALDASLKRLNTDYLDLINCTGRSAPTALANSTINTPMTKLRLRCWKRWRR